MRGSIIFTKVDINRISSNDVEVIRPTQTTFIHGRHILQSVLVLYEIIDKLHRKKLDEVLLKIDFEKAHGKVK
jgi:hypothetical protein